ncbi:transposase [Streptococcus pneumoniae]|nr:transposase [Streptococcus pneumoniae]
MSRVRVQIMNQFHRKSHEYKAIKRYWKLIQQDSRKLSDKRFYRPTFRMHLTNKEILDKLLSYSQDLKHHYQLYQLLLFHFQNKKPEKFFGLIEDNLKQVHPIFQTVFKTFLKDKEKIVNALQLHYSNAKLEATNNLIKLIKRNAFGFRNFENFKKRIFIALNIKKERTRKILTISISSLFLREEHKLSSEITFLNMIEPSDVASKSLLWICLALTMTWLNSFAFKFLGSG